jgi:hypothetical protein
MERTLFTQAEAESKMGQPIESLIPFSGVPQGTTGKVVAADDAGDGWDVAIEWDLPPRPFGTRMRPLRDWFVKSEYDKYLREIQPTQRVGNL